VSAPADLKAIHDLLEASMRPRAKEDGWTAELLDENNPDGAVVLKDRRGNIQMMMPRSVYEDLRKEKP
jgi:Fe-S cluster biogenesis protein NfuA